MAGNETGGNFDAAVSRLHLPHHGLTDVQFEMKISRRFRIVGACVGVVMGCLVG